MKEKQRKIDWKNFWKFYDLYEYIKAKKLGFPKRIDSEWVAKNVIRHFKAVNCSEKLLKILSLAERLHSKLRVLSIGSYNKSDFNKATILNHELLTALYRYSKSENLGLEKNVKILKAEFEDLIRKNSKNLFLLRSKQILNSYFWVVCDETIEEMSRNNDDFRRFVKNRNKINSLIGDLMDIVSISKLLKIESEGKRNLQRIFPFSKEMADGFFKKTDENFFKREHLYMPSRAAMNESGNKAIEKINALYKNFKNPMNIFSNNFGEEIEKIFKGKVKSLEDIEFLEKEEAIKARDQLEEIQNFIQRKKRITAKQLSRKFNKSLKWAYNQLNELKESDLIEKEKKYYKAKS